MAATPLEHTQDAPRLDDDALRANTYTLLARLLRATPDGELLDTLSAIDAGDKPGSDLGMSWHLLKLSATHAQPERLDDEFHDLFIGLGHGEVIPYGSWYQTGYLMDKPLAKLRYDLDILGVEREAGVSEPEDHVAALCEVMALLIGQGAPLARQQQFFRDHMASWLGRCFADIENAPSAQFYKAVGQLGQHFAELEKRYMDVTEYSAS